jgi:hypothetical protein
MLNSFLFAEAPDGGFGYKDSKDSCLGIVFTGSNEDMGIAQAAMQLCQEVTGWPLYLDKVLDQALVSTVCDSEGHVVNSFIQVRVNKEILMDIAKDSKNPRSALIHDLEVIYDFIDFIDEQRDIFGDQQQYGLEIRDSLIEFYNAVRCLFVEDPFNCEVDVLDMAWAQTHPDWKIANANMKNAYAIQRDYAKGRYPME